VISSSPGLALSLAVATLASEDLACIGAGLLAANGEIGVMTGIIGCAAGIVAGDVGLWAIGRTFGPAALRWRPLAGRIDEARVSRLREWLERNAGEAILASRFLPGARLPLYLAAGVAGMAGLRFASWALVAALVWTPLLVLASASVGATVAGKLPFVFGGLAAIVMTARWVVSPHNRVRLGAWIARYQRWEFWPMGIFYLPVVVRVAVLSVRYRGLSTITAANPGMPDGGTVGESKADILRRLPTEWTVPFEWLDAGEASDRVHLVAETLRQRDWRFPIVLKPDVGQRGVGVRVMRSSNDVARYLSAERGAVIVQPYHEGPYEAGVFYYRRPGEGRGRILSITDKYFPFITGDGVATIEELIWRHPRYRMQARTFLERHAAVRHRVLPDGERLQLAIAGNHAQGTMFRNGRHLITPALEERIDQIARSYPGFFIGRFDIRYGDPEAFMAGSDLTIVELNGATAECTEIYDPDASLLSAYHQLFRQWSLVFEIGTANRARGVSVAPLSRLVRLVKQHLSARVAYAVSD
jgi:membrane protein DedA with SNARE-associated domain